MAPIHNIYSFPFLLLSSGLSHQVSSHSPSHKYDSFVPHLGNVDILCKQILGRVLHVVARESADEKVAMVVAVLVAHVDLLACRFGSLL